MKTRSAATDTTPSFVFTLADLGELLQERAGPCVSVYFPSHVRKTEARSDSILYRNLCREVEKMLQQGSDPAIAREILGNLRSLDDPTFWERGSEGVAVFAASGYFRCWRLPMQCPQLEVVGGSFHTKPLIRFLQSGVSYWALAVSPGRVALYDGWGDSLQEVPLETVPKSIDELAAEEGNTRPLYPHVGNSEPSTADLERFCREIGKALAKSVVKDPRKPLILATSVQIQPIFRKVVQLPGLLEQGLTIDAARLTMDEIRSHAVRVLEPELERRVQAARDAFVHAISKGHGSDRMQQIARACAEGRVQKLCVQSGRRFWGLLDRHTGDIMPGEAHKNAFDVDVYDELAEMTLGQGGEVFVLREDQMPVSSGIAAVFRY